jgi:hypothetical protein
MEDVELESSSEEEELELESSLDVVVSSDVELESVELESVELESVEPESVEEVVVDVAAACWLADVDVVVPIEPSYAMAPKATANVANATAATRRRRRAMRSARARSFAWARSAGEGGGGVMDGTVGAVPESGLGAGWELPERPARSRSGPSADSGCCQARRPPSRHRQEKELV